MYTHPWKYWENLSEFTVALITMTFNSWFSSSNSFKRISRKSVFISRSCTSSTITWLTPVDKKIIPPESTLEFQLCSLASLLPCPHGGCLNLLSPSINKQIVQTDLHNYIPLRISWQNIFKDQSIFSLVIIRWILDTFSFDYVVILF